MCECGRLLAPKTLNHISIWPQVLHAIRARKSPQFSVDRTLTHMAVGALLLMLLLPSAGPLWEDEMFTREGQVFLFLIAY